MFTHLHVTLNRQVTFSEILSKMLTHLQMIFNGQVTFSKKKKKKMIKNVYSPPNHTQRTGQILTEIIKMFTHLQIIFNRQVTFSKNKYQSCLLTLVGQISETIFHFWKQAPKLAHILLRYCSFDKTR